MTSQLRRPRSLVKVNGTIIGGLKAWTWDGNTLFQADTFSVEFALGKLPKGNDVAWFATQTALDVEIFLGFPQNPAQFDVAELTSLFQGRVDECEVDWAGRCLKLTGRDRTADFLDNKTSEKFPNLTASQVATKLAGRHGLTPIVTATSAKVGRYYKTDNVRLQDDRTEWDLLTFLAREEGFIVYVKGSELHFEPRPKGAATYALKWVEGQNGQAPSGNFVRLSTTRVLTVARDIAVTVRSWNSKQKKAFSRKAVRNKPGRGTVQQYVYTIAGLTPEQAQLRADQLLAELSKHEMKLSVTGPADNVLGKADVIGLSGTGTAFDQTYFPDSIRRSFDVDGAYTWRIEAKNHDPESQPNL